MDNNNNNKNHKNNNNNNGMNNGEKKGPWDKKCHCGCDNCTQVKGRCACNCPNCTCNGQPKGHCCD